MEVVPTSNLVSLENEKNKTKQKKTIKNFQTMAMNSFVIPHDLMIGQRGTYAYIKISSYS